MSSTDLVTLTEANPLADMRRSDGTWSAREVHASGHVHADWRNWEAAIRRGDVLLKQFGLSAGHHEVGSTTTVVMKPMPRGQAPVPDKVDDYRLTALALFAACQQSNLPELDLWFVFAGMQAAGYGISAPQQSVAQVLAEHAAQLQNISFHENGTVKWVQFQKRKLTGAELKDAIMELMADDLKADEENDREFNSYLPARHTPVLAEKVVGWLSRFFPKPVAHPTTQVALPPAQDAAVNLQKILAPFAGIAIDRMQLALSSTLHESYGMVGVAEIDRDRVVEAMKGLDPSTIIQLYHAVELQYKDAPGTLPGFSLVVRAYREGLVRDGLL